MLSRISIGLKPLSSARMVYGPGCSAGNAKRPTSLRDGAPHFLRLLVRDDDVGARNDLIL